ncbi:aconitate hydratase [Mycobacterium sp. M23085]|uniref:aconitate hydratase n=1 Tax=Mycobacterium sp. M23085 TaxID=3378087 RepID=UPI0038779773
MADNLTRKLIADHLVDGEMTPGSEIALSIDQILLHDASGPMVALELAAMGLDEIKAPLAVAYTDHLLLESDSRNADDHLLLESAARRFGMWFSRSDNGVSHAVHQQRFGVPGQSLLGGDSHTPAAGSLGMLAIGAGGLAIALTLAGEPFRIAMPEVWGVELIGELPDWVSAKDVVLEMLRRHGVDGGKGRVVEYFGDGLRQLSAMDRHVVANMGTEMGATSTVFPSDTEVRAYLRKQHREHEWRALAADDGAGYDVTDRLDLSELEPLIALPSSPGNVKPVAEVAGDEIYQAYIGSSANPGFRDIAVVAEIVKGHRVPPDVSLDINPASRQSLEQLIDEGHLTALIRAGARLHQTGCNGCIGMGQAPASGRRSLRTVPRNFPGRSGASEDQVYLCSPETAAASALNGVITDPRTLDMPYPRISEPKAAPTVRELLVPPGDGESAELVRGPHHADIPDFDPVPDEFEVPVLLTVDDHLTTDAIMPAGVEGMSLWSDLPGMMELTFRPVDESYVQRARESGDHAIVAGRNYGQGSSREQAALAPRALGLRVVLAESIARIHAENLVYFGVLPLIFTAADDRRHLDTETTLRISGVHKAIRGGPGEFDIQVGGGRTVRVRHDLSPRQAEMLLAGGGIPWKRRQLADAH